MCYTGIDNKSRTPSASAGSMAGGVFVESHAPRPSLALGVLITPSERLSG